MTSVAIDVPAMYADHHVIEVRRVLFDVPGVTAVYASSAFGVVEIDFDAGRTTTEALEQRLNEAGYLSDLPVPMELGEAATGRTAAGEKYRRYTTTRPGSGSAVAFRQDLATAASASPCTGEGPSELKEQ
jgi:copper chaperone CopZ